MDDQKIGDPGHAEFLQKEQWDGRIYRMDFRRDRPADLIIL